MVWLLLMLTTPAKAFGLRDASIGWNSFHKSARHPLFYGKNRLSERIALSLDLNLVGPLYFWSDVHGESSDSQFRAVGWHFRVYLEPCPWLQLGYEHHSRHNLDQPTPPYLRGFPVEDSVFVRVHLVMPK